MPLIFEKISSSFDMYYRLSYRHHCYHLFLECLLTFMPLRLERIWFFKKLKKKIYLSAFTTSYGSSRELQPVNKQHKPYNPSGRVTWAAFLFSFGTSSVNEHTVTVDYWYDHYCFCAVCLRQCFSVLFHFLLRHAFFHECGRPSSRNWDLWSHVTQHSTTNNHTRQRTRSASRRLTTGNNSSIGECWACTSVQTGL